MNRSSISLIHYKMPCNTTNGNATTAVGLFEFLAYSPVFLVGFFVNVAALRAFISIRRSWTDTHIYMLNLAVADLALILSLPFRIYDTFFPLPKTCLCTFLISVHFINMYASMMTTTAISVHRYLVVRFPLQARFWKRKKAAAASVCLIIWALLVALAFVFRKENYPERLWTCYERCKDNPLSLKFIILLVFVAYSIPLLTTVFCSSQVIILLRKHSSSGEKKSLVGIVTANLIVFVVCYTPIHIAFVVNYFQTVPSNWMDEYLPAHAFLRVSEWISSTNCCFDSISYYFLLKKIYT
ncbi:G-protein coupled receptor 35 [Kryptolebias marmoratus]|uniref:G-protein coupled receptor 35-like n=1 Tax=Kryptolebias marmoratus TaxID=37003 RepID=A0A3Q3A1J7_KRYMA|nr:G-protein coupled receptor 35 [Kryptolebias marmoratus]XP_017277693.1 G-protein coupled receptor 35 [Kryptolebias marmoratus]XP_024862987.1 G-protein coupled receptor 35 [Kryptolebias marmoratus]XP_024862988.1 G-protein coupled receptor 35 [Kryptolebias marmoratus]XP_024862990.1 G-protein coupled receptor 35 [Kryptolebias marmoratus]XP_024862991.1 G-protein coupled receptor 35 [Kryptolebias marmoratus]XP_024862992.1 G-protein coupled receptor 35 [Kryptolebias marmoratus]XP_037838010.1 G-p